MAENTPTVTVRALQYHTYNGQEYDAGDTYEISSDLVDSITAQGKATPVTGGTARASRTKAFKATKAGRLTSIKGRPAKKKK